MAACAECGVQSLSLAVDLANPSVSYCNGCWEAYEEEVERKRLISTATKILKRRQADVAETPRAVSKKPAPGAAVPPLPAAPPPTAPPRPIVGGAAIDIQAAAVDAEVLLRGKRGEVLAVVFRNFDGAHGRHVVKSADIRPGESNIRPGTAKAMAEPGRTSSLTKGNSISNDNFEVLFNSSQPRSLDALRAVRAAVWAVEESEGQQQSRIFAAAEEGLDCSLRVHDFPLKQEGAAPSKLARMFYGLSSDQFNWCRVLDRKEGGRMHGHVDEDGTDGVVLLNLGECDMFFDQPGRCKARQTRETWCVGGGGGGEGHWVVWDDAPHKGKESRYRTEEHYTHLLRDRLCAACARGGQGRECRSCERVRLRSGDVVAFSGCAAFHGVRAVYREQPPPPTARGSLPDWMESRLGLGHRVSVQWRLTDRKRAEAKRLNESRAFAASGGEGGPSAAPPPAATFRVDPAVVDSLSAMGFPREDALAALAAAFGDAARAVDYLVDPSSVPASRAQGGREGEASRGARTMAERIRSMAGGRIVWDDTEPLHRWIEAVKPSLVPAAQVAWVQVHSRAAGTPGSSGGGDFSEAPYQPALQQISDIIDRGANVPAAAKRECVERLLDTARRQGYTTGKWMVFLEPGVADAAWAAIARATATGELGCSAKVAPTGAGPDELVREAVVCCVYVRDFDERAELQRVLRALMALMAPLQVPVTAGFKPDAFTMLGIDGKQNRWRLPPTVHSVAEALAWDVAPAPPAPGTQQDPIELDG